MINTVRTLLFARCSTILLLFFTESAIIKGLRQCQCQCLAYDGRPKFPYFLVLLMGRYSEEKRRLCFFSNVKAYEFLIQIFIHGQCVAVFLLRHAFA